MFVEILKIMFLFVGIMYSISNIFSAIYGEDLIVGNQIAQAVGITGFIYLQWLM